MGVPAPRIGISLRDKLDARMLPQCVMNAKYGRSFQRLFPPTLLRSSLLSSISPFSPSSPSFTSSSSPAAAADLHNPAGISVLTKPFVKLDLHLLPSVVAKVAVMHKLREFCKAYAATSLHSDKSLPPIPPNLPTLVLVTGHGHHRPQGRKNMDHAGYQVVQRDDNALRTFRMDSVLRPAITAHCQTVLDPPINVYLVRGNHGSLILDKGMMWRYLCANKKPPMPTG